MPVSLGSRGKITVAPMTKAFAVRSTNEVSHPSSFQRSHPPPVFRTCPVQERLLGTVQVMSLHDAPETKSRGSSGGRSLITKILNCIGGLEKGVSAMTALRLRRLDLGNRQI
jgi:hypothetical protein